MLWLPCCFPQYVHSPTPRSECANFTPEIFANTCRHFTSMAPPPPPSVRRLNSAVDGWPGGLEWFSHGVGVAVVSAGVVRVEPADNLLQTSILKPHSTSLLTPSYLTRRLCTTTRVTPNRSLQRHTNCQSSLSSRHELGCSPYRHACRLLEAQLVQAYC